MRQLKITKSITNRESQSLEKYLQEIGKVDLLTPEEEVDLAQRIKEGDQEALERLTKANLRFVVSVAKQYQNQGLSLSDLINEGNLGLIKAAQRFDETRGFKFISYAVWWIRQSILQALAEQSRIVRLPLNKVGSLNKINRAFSELEQEFEREPTPDELALLLEIPAEEVETTLGVAARHVSMDAPFAEGEDNSLLDVLENTSTPDTDKGLEYLESLRTEIEKGIIPWDKDTVVQLYDQIADEVNNTFPQFMLDYFHVPKSRGEVIKGGRELVASRGLFITKKRYGVMVYDKEGKRLDNEVKPGKIKVMGLDLKRSDTPEYMQNFLEKVLTMVLVGKEEKEILDEIVNFRSEFKSRPGWAKGSPRRANNITEYQEKERKAGKANMPGHVRAAINWNTLRKMNGDKYSMQIVDGMKVYVCKLKNNAMGYTSIAYPVDELRLPKWFQDLPFDDAAMEETIIDNKISNLIGVLEWDISSTTTSGNNFSKLFDFE
jgi:RNA polymerase primary sigma factor